MVYYENGVYQEAFYDHGSLIPGDNAKITAVCRGTNSNYASIYYSDESMSFYINRKNSVRDSTPRYFSFTSDYDVLDAGSYAYSNGAVELDLNVVK